MVFFKPPIEPSFAIISQGAFKIPPMAFLPHAIQGAWVNQAFPTGFDTGKKVGRRADHFIIMQSHDHRDIQFYRRVNDRHR
jgi:hypothetical protein